MGFTEEILGEIEGFILALLPMFSSFISYILNSSGMAFSSIIFSSLMPAGIFGPSLMVFTFAMTFAFAMGAFSFVKGISDVTGGA